MSDRAMRIDRRTFLRGSALAAAGTSFSTSLFAGLQIADGAPLNLPQELPEGLRQNAMLATLPGKKPLIKLSYRPPNYEAPIEYLRTAITPNDEFYVRYHLADIPEVNPATWKVAVGGAAANGQSEFTLDDLKKMPAAEIVAVNQCSGNRRGLFQPHVPGVEWGYGAMGCARWKGVKLKDVLDKVGVKKDAIEVAFDGADGPVLDKTPDFIKSIPAWKAMEDSTLIAYEMNGQPLPHFNGAPARIVVPGWTGTYWMKHVTRIDVRSTPQGGFWMNPAYRLPLGKFPLVARFVSQETDANTPITEIVVNSLISNPVQGATVKPGSAVSGIAWDGGYGIRVVEISTDGGQTWRPATLGEDLGRYAFRTWSYKLGSAKGKITVMARATNAIGQTQTGTLILNPAGYNHNVIQSLALTVA